MNKCRSCRSITMSISWDFAKTLGGCTPTLATSFPLSICISRSEMLLGQAAAGAAAAAIGHHSTRLVATRLITTGKSREATDLLFGRSAFAFWTSCLRGVVHAGDELVKSMPALFTEKFINRHIHLHRLRAPIRKNSTGRHIPSFIVNWAGHSRYSECCLYKTIIYRKL